MVKEYFLRYFALFLFSQIVLVYSQLKMTTFEDYENLKDVKMLAQSQNKFMFNLYKIVSKETEGNVFFSPYSISSALTMIHMGSAGKTEAQLQKAFCLPSDKNAIARAYGDVITDFKKPASEYDLRTSNSAYISEHLPLLEGFSSALKKYFLTEFHSVDFDQSDAVRNRINADVERDTNGKIKDLLAAGAIVPLTRLVVVNALYLKGLWEEAFLVNRTRSMPFHLSKAKQVDVPMMNAEREFRFAPLPELKAHAVALDYKGDRMSLLLLVPEEIDGLSSVEEGLQQMDLAELNKRMMPTKMKLYVPRFKVEQSIDLIPHLSNLGVSDLFTSGKCDLSAMTSADVFVSKVVTKAVLEVNEEGAEAAAATAAVVMLRCAFRVFEVRADRPFLVVVLDRRSEQPLFLGRVNDPSASLGAPSPNDEL